MRFYWERVEASRNFANKVWNASRFMLMNFEQASEAGITIDHVQLSDLTQADQWILSKANTLAKDVTENIDAMNWGLLFRSFMILSGTNSVTGTLRW